MYKESLERKCGGCVKRNKREEGGIDRKEGKEGAEMEEGERERRKKGRECFTPNLRCCDNGGKMGAGKNCLCLFWLHLERKLECLVDSR